MAEVVNEKRKYQRILPSMREQAILKREGFTWVFSSNVSGVATSGRDLIIRFHNASIYSYQNQASKFEDILAAASKGKWVWRFLRRPNVPYQKIGSLPLDQDVDVTDEELFEDVTGIAIEDVTMLGEKELDLFNQLTVGLINTNISSGIALAELGLVFGTDINIGINLM